jgi:hypothetical protein
MDDSQATSLEQIRAFLAEAGEVRFAGRKREEVYRWAVQTLGDTSMPGIVKLGGKESFWFVLVAGQSPQAAVTVRQTSKDRDRKSR